MYCVIENGKCLFHRIETITDSVLLEALMFRTLQTYVNIRATSASKIFSVYFFAIPIYTRRAQVPVYYSIINARVLATSFASSNQRDNCIELAFQFVLYPNGATTRI